MGERLWLPIGNIYKPYLNPQTEREELLNRLWELRVLIPGSQDMPTGQLRDYVQWQERKANDLKAKEAKKLAAQATSQIDPMQRRDALRDYINWRRRKQGEKPVQWNN